MSRLFTYITVHLCLDISVVCPKYSADTAFEVFEEEPETERGDAKVPAFPDEACCEDEEEQSRAYYASDRE